MSQSAEKSLPEVFPRVSFDINHGKYVDEIDVDLEAVTDQLRKGDLSDEEIIELPIHFSAKKVDRSESVVGYYQPNRTFPKRSEHIKLGHPHTLRSVQDSKIEPDGYDMLSINKDASEDYSDTLAHELEHAVAARDPLQREKNEAYEDKGLIDTLKTAPYGPIAAGSLIGQLAYVAYESAGGSRAGETDLASWSVMAATVAIGSLAGVVQRKRKWKKDEYWDHPEEIRARAAADVAPDGLVKVVLKSRPPEGKV